MILRKSAWFSFNVWPVAPVFFLRLQSSTWPKSWVKTMPLWARLWGKRLFWGKNCCFRFCWKKSWRKKPLHLVLRGFSSMLRSSRWWFDNGWLKILFFLAQRHSHGRRWKMGTFWIYHPHTHTVIEASESLGWDPLLKHVMILVVTGNLGLGVRSKIPSRSIMFHLGSLVELPWPQDITVNCIAPAVVQTASQLSSDGSNVASLWAVTRWLGVG